MTGFAPCSEVRYLAEAEGSSLAADSIAELAVIAFAVADAGQCLSSVRTEDGLPLTRDETVTLIVAFGRLLRVFRGLDEPEA
jgi:hypothetical protein